MTTHRLYICLLFIMICLSFGPANTLEEINDQNDGGLDLSVIEPIDVDPLECTEVAEFTIQDRVTSRVTLT